MGITSDQIEVLKGLEAIRRRPAMYLGDPRDPSTLTCLLVETLCLAADELTAGTATRATVTLLADGSIAVEDDGRGVSVDQIGGGLRYAEAIASRLHACRLLKVAHPAGERFCTAGIAVSNALSASFELAIARDGEAWFQRYERGRAVAPLARLGATDGHGTALCFRPDPDFFGAARVDPHALAERLLELDRDVAGSLAVVDLQHASGRLA